MTMGKGAGLVLVAALALPVVASAQQAPMPDPRQLDARIERLERLMDNQALMDMMRRIEALEQDLRRLQGAAETGQHEVEQLRTRQRDLYLDVDQRLQALEAARAAAPESAAPSPPVVAPAGGDSPAPAVPSAAGNDQQDYRAAFDLLREGRYEQSAEAFSRFLDTHPESGLAANAQYWLGEARYVSRSFEAALQEFDKVLTRFPDSDKVPDARLKKGFTHYELGQWSEARDMLEKVVREHGGTAVARLAEQRLRRMRDEGR